MKVLSQNELLFPTVKSAKFVLYSCGFNFGGISLPERGVTFFPPEQKFTDGSIQSQIRIRFDFLDGDGMSAVRQALLFYQNDPARHSLRLIIPGESPGGYDVEPYGQWRAWFIDDEPQGYGPVEAVFITTESPAVAEPDFSNIEPWVVE